MNKKYITFIFIFAIALIVGTIIDGQKKPVETGFPPAVIDEVNSIPPSEPMSSRESLTTGTPTTVPTSEPIIFEPTASTPDPDNRVRNGYFLEAFTEWEREIVDEGGASKAHIVDSANSPFNRALEISQSGNGMISFGQLIPIDTLNLNLSMTFSPSATTTSYDIFGGSGYAVIIIAYLDSAQKPLGSTQILNINESAFAGGPAVGAPDKISDSNDTHYIRVESDKVYKDFSLNLYDEVSGNLLGIDPAEVANIHLIFVAGSNDKKETGSLTVSDVLLK